MMRFKRVIQQPLQIAGNALMATRRRRHHHGHTADELPTLLLRPRLDPRAERLDRQRGWDRVSHAVLSRSSALELTMAERSEHLWLGRLRTESRHPDRRACPRRLPSR